VTDIALNVYNAGQKQHSNSSSCKCLANDVAMRSLHYHFDSLVQAINLTLLGNISGFIEYSEKKYSNELDSVNMIFVARN
jgi:hypothetical protein